MSASSPSVFISFEGVDGSGKSTQSVLLRDRLEQMGYSVILTSEPGGSEGAKRLRPLLLDTREGLWSRRAELMLFLAARCDHVDQVIRPALEQGSIVICDRFTDSTFAYTSSEIILEWFSGKMEEMAAAVRKGAELHKNMQKAADDNVGHFLTSTEIIAKIFGSLQEEESTGNPTFH